MGRNFGLGSRDMGRAGQMALNAAAQRGAVSFFTAATNGERWGQFATWARESGINKMEKITPEAVRCFGLGLSERIHNGEMAPSTAQNLISAVNSVMELATNTNRGWSSVSPTKDCRIPARSGIASESKAINPTEHARLTGAVTERIATLMALQRNLGLRFEESAKLNAVRALVEAHNNGQVHIKAGTKGGRARRVPASPAAIAALEQASRIQAGDRSMIPQTQNYAQFQSGAYRELIQAGGGGFHGERHDFAQARYRELTGAPAPVAAGWPRKERFQCLAEYLSIPIAMAKEIDQEARARIAQELGHNRIEITDAYLG